MNKIFVGDGENSCYFCNRVCPVNDNSCCQECYDKVIKYGLIRGESLKDFFKRNGVSSFCPSCNHNLQLQFIRENKNDGDIVRCNKCKNRYKISSFEYCGFNYTKFLTYD